MTSKLRPNLAASEVAWMMVVRFLPNAVLSPLSRDCASPMLSSAPVRLYALMARA
jgi:hypothetical protein